MSYRTFTRVDNSQCRVCGARAGQCEHTQAHHDQIVPWDGRSDAGKENTYYKWSKREREIAVDLHSAGRSLSEIAELMSTTRNAVAGVLHRHGS